MNSRSVSSRWKQERAERIVRTKTAYASHESLIDSAPWLKFPLVRKYGIEGGEGETLDQRNRGERHSMNFHRGLLSPSPPPLADLAADFFIDNRDSVTSLRESYGSRSSPSTPPLFHRLLDSRWGRRGGQRRSWITVQPREWQLTADQIWISKLDDDLFLRPSIRLSAGSIFIISDPAAIVTIKHCFRSIFQQEWMDG